MRDAMILGIDPGATGALALYEAGRLTKIEDMPVSAKEVDAVVLAILMQQLCPTRPDAVVIERQFCLPKQGVTSTFKTGLRFGLILGVCGALLWRIEIVSSIRWKAFCQVTRDKDASRARASQLMPEAAHYWTRVKDHGRAEAALIAWYGAHTLALKDAA